MSETPGGEGRSDRDLGWCIKTFTKLSQRQDMPPHILFEKLKAQQSSICLRCAFSVGDFAIGVEKKWKSPTADSAPMNNKGRERDLVRGRSADDAVHYQVTCAAELSK